MFCGNSINHILPSLLKTLSNSFKEDFQQFPLLLILVKTINVSQISLPLEVRIFPE